ncbi:predicted protein [Plenodomus lingam JN3]|uniref:Predicted protein n=1 Tax=Leptosphaeria maculans (strain JN3 / isolate v23.1.3 / race Av1-4-5-6-7-8) TaxID=985895 RepID=E5R4P6_LEPMJ|nr:predicted protein [Plenodomus lingam JN3]CBX92169.1 predicted protein [Plenodomus lingam JN3]
MASKTSFDYPAEDTIGYVSAGNAFSCNLPRILKAFFDAPGVGRVVKHGSFTESPTLSFPGTEVTSQETEKIEKAFFLPCNLCPDLRMLPITNPCTGQAAAVVVLCWPTRLYGNNGFLYSSDVLELICSRAAAKSTTDCAEQNVSAKGWADAFVFLVCNWTGNPPASIHS